MLNSVQLLSQENKLINLMFDFITEKPDIYIKIETTSMLYHSFIKTVADELSINQSDAWKLFEEMQRKISGAESIYVDSPIPTQKIHKLDSEELNFLKLLFDYLSPEPKMACAGSSKENKIDSIIETYQYFFKTFKGNGEVAKEKLFNLKRKIQAATNIKIETVAPIILNPNPYKAVLDLLQTASEKLNLEQDIHEMLKRPMRTLIVNVPVKMDDGKINVFTGYRVQYNDALGPAKGGIRYHPEVTLDEVIALSAWMTWKTAVAGLPLGGGKGAIRCNPKEMSKNELEKLTRGYTRQIARFIGPYTDVPAPDVYTDAQTMAWIMDEYSQIVGYNAFGVVTGKPVSLGGSLGRGEATSRGLMYTVIEATKHLGINLKGATVAVQGYGNVGYHACKLLSELGCKIIAITDSKGGIYDPNGFDPKKVHLYKQQTGSVVGFNDAKKLNNTEVLEIPCDILIPAALENQITETNANKIQAKIIAEGANGPTTPMADDILYQKGIFIIPDILASAGGVIVSYFEQVQNQMNYYWSESEVQQKLEKTIVTAFNGVVEVSKEHKVNMRVAAYMNALKRVADSILVRTRNSLCS